MLNGESALTCRGVGKPEWDGRSPTCRKYQLKLKKYFHLRACPKLEHNYNANQNLKCWIFFREMSDFNVRSLPLLYSSDIKIGHFLKTVRKF